MHLELDFLYIHLTFSITWALESIPKESLWAALTSITYAKLVVEVVLLFKKLDNKDSPLNQQIHTRNNLILTNNSHY